MRRIVTHIAEALNTGFLRCCRPSFVTEVTLLIRKRLLAIWGSIPVMDPHL
jgi:hypothetical protein